MKKAGINTIKLNFQNSKNIILKNVLRIFEREVRKRCDVEILSSGKCDLLVELEIDRKIGKDGYRIEEENNTIKISGGNEVGVLYGIGKFLRDSYYNNKRFFPSTWRGISIPEKEVRGIYFATHFHNFYHEAPLEKIKEYIEELALWGYNTVIVWFDMHHFNGINDTEAKKMIVRLREILITAKNIGLRVGLGTLANESYANSPKELRADQTFPGTKHLRGGFGVELCPSKPGAKELMLKWFEEEFESFSDIGIDYVWAWPYDQGGCCCEKCSPWGANGFLIMAKEISNLARKYFPNSKFILSTWLFDNNEWEGLKKAFLKRPSWVNYILADSHSDFPEYPLKNGVPGNLPLLNFPEISMWGMAPWGGFGANPFPKRLQKLWEQVKDIISGGFAYSEGIFEDINKIIVSQFYWNDKNSLETIKEYVKFYFSLEAVKDVSEVIEILERNHNFFFLKKVPCEVPKKMIDDGEKAYFIMKSVDSKLEEWAKNSWRWRIIFLRTFIDNERLKNKGEITKKCNEAFEELTKLYYAENAQSCVAPPKKGNV